MGRSILFVLGQAGTAAYLAPVLRYWASWDGAPVWSVWVTEPAGIRLSAEGLGMFSAPEDLSSAWEALSPGLVVVSASQTSLEAEAIRLAQRDAVPIHAILDTWYGYARRCAGQRFARVLVIDSVAAQSAVQEGIDPETVLVVGHPGWEDLPPLPAADARQILFVSQPIRRLYGSELGYDERSAFGLLETVARQRPDLIREIVFSPHPEDDFVPPDGIRVVKGRQGIAEAGTVVGLFSSLLVDALVAHRKLILLHPGQDRPAISLFGERQVGVSAGDGAGLVRALEGAGGADFDLASAVIGSCERLTALWGRET